MKSLADQTQLKQYTSMSNKAMLRKLLTHDALDVCVEGREVEPGVYRLRRFCEGVDYCDASKEAWIWSIGKRKTDGEILASTDSRYYRNDDFECLWLR
jgi:hypothetical protein